MLLRFRGPDGTFRLTVDPGDEFMSLQSKVGPLPHLLSQDKPRLMLLRQLLDHLPKNVDSSSITLSNKPANGQVRRLKDLKGVTLAAPGLR